MLKIISTVFVVLTLLNGCVSQNSQQSQKFGQNFDQLKAAKTRVSLGLTYLKNGNFSQAKYNLDKALEFAPRSANANFAMAYYYQNVGELEQAESAYQFAMDLEPKNANIANSYGAFLCQNGEYEKAKKYFLKAVNTSSYISSAETYENLALCSQSQGKPEDAIQYLRSAVNHQPGRANSLFLLTSSLVETQQWQEAKDILKRYEKTSQVSPQSLLMAMKIARGTGNETAAKGYSDMLLRIFPNSPVTKSMLTVQQPVPKTVPKVVPPVAVVLVKTAPKPVESKVTATALARLETEPQNNDSVVSEKVKNVPVDGVSHVVVPIIDEPDNSDAVVVSENETTLAVDDIVQVAVSVVEPSGVNVPVANEQETTELPEGEVVQVTVSVAEPSDNNDVVAAENEAERAAVDIAQDAPVVDEKITELDTQTEPSMLDKPDFHVVTKGDNLYQISLLYNIRMQRLIEWNDLEGSAIFVGMTLSLVAPNVVE